MRKFLLTMMIGVGLSLSTTFAMEYSVTDCKLEYRDDHRAIVSCTFHNESDSYYSEMYYVPQIQQIVMNGETKFRKNYLALDPVMFSIGANESKELKYDYVISDNLPNGSYCIAFDFYEGSKRISEYSEKMASLEIEKSEDLFKIEEFFVEEIVIDDQPYKALLGINVKKDSEIYAKLSLKLTGEDSKILTPKIKMYEKNTMSPVISETLGKSFELQPDEEKEVLIKLPMAHKPMSYLFQIVLLDEQSQVVSKTYEFRYVLVGASATITYLKYDNGKIKVGLVGPADASTLENCEISCDIYDSNNKLLNSVKQIQTISNIENEIEILLDDLENGAEFSVEVTVSYQGEQLAQKINKFNFNKISTILSDIKGTKYEYAVTLLNGLGIINGYPDGTFKPGNPITRAEYTVIADKLAKLELEDGSGRFNDIALHWGEKYIETAAKNGLLSGYPDGTFRPDNLVTYAESLTILLNMLGYNQEVNESEFLWPQNYINKATDIKLTDNVEIEDYSNPANRGDVALMALNAYLLKH